MVSTFEWTEDMSVGVEQLDDDHKRLLLHVRDLHRAMLQGQGREVAAEILHKVVRYTRTHFANEEALFLKYGLHVGLRHRESHQGLLTKVDGLVDRVERGDLGVSIDLSHLLADWVIRHIRGEDRGYAKYLRARGAT